MARPGAFCPAAVTISSGILDLNNLALDVLGGSLIVELIYGIPGVSRLALDAIFQRDFPVMTAFVLIGAVMLVLANLVIDIAYTIIDPRIRLN